jgi:uncharacterized protein
MLDEIITISMLYDFYGNLLPDKQKEFLKLYHEENYSLAEIAHEFGLSRQGVYDSVKKAERALYAYEEKLGLMLRFKKTELALEKIDSALDALLEKYSKDSTLTAQLIKIKNTADALGE